MSYFNSNKYNHQIEAASRRYGANLTPFDLDLIAKRIVLRHTSCTCIFAKIPDTKGIIDGVRQVWRIKYEKTDFLLVFRSGKNEVITFLPSDQEFFPDGRQKGNKAGR